VDRKSKRHLNNLAHGGGCQVRAVDVNQALGLIDEVNSKEESKISEKLQREKEKIAAFKAKQKEKRQKKEKKKEKVTLASLCAVFPFLH